MHHFTTLGIGRFVTGQVIRQTIQTAEGPLVVTAKVETQGTTIILKNLSVSHPGGLEVVTSPSVGPLKAAAEALKSQFAADGYTRLVIKGLRTTGRYSPRYISIPISLKK